MAPNFSKHFIENLVNELIVDFTVKPGSNVGDNMAGDLYAVRIETVSGKIHNIVIKMLLEKDSSFKEHMRAQRIFALEIGMYTTVKVSLENLIEYRGQAQYLTVPFPTFFGGICDGEVDYLALEDLRPQGFKMPDKFAGLNYAEVKLILEELGKFHALTYSLIKYEGEKFFQNDDAVKMLVKNIWDDPNTMGMIETMIVNTLKNAVDILKVQDEKLAEQVQNTFDYSTLYEIYMEVSRLTDNKLFPVIILGDCWVNNILIKYNNRKEPVDVKFIDFQQSRRGNVLEDLLYFIFTSTTPDFRTKHLHQVLNVYFESFKSTVTRLKCPMPLNFSLGKFMDQFNDGYLHAFIYMTFAIPLQLGNYREADKTPEDDENALVSASRFRKLMDGSSRAIERLESIAREYVQLKIFL